MRRRILFFSVLLAFAYLLSGGVSLIPQNTAFRLPQRCPLNPELLRPFSTEFGLIPHTMDLSHLDMEADITIADALPVSWDWRDHNGVTPAKNQTSCPVCWAFAATGVLEANVMVDSGTAYDFSEESMKECNYQSRGCFGGTIFRATSYLTTQGTVLEECAPYNPDTTGVCNTSCPKIIQVTDWRLVGTKDMTAVKNAIYQYGPIYTTMYASFPEFIAYDGSYVVYYTGDEGTNHAVMIVGWDDDMAHAGGTGAWICKNSWGTDWGDNGFFYIAYGSARIGGMGNYFKSFKEYDYSETLYHYDEGGWKDSYGFEPDDTAWGLVKFAADKDELIDAVDFWAVSGAAEYTIYIYDDFDGSSLSNLRHSQSGSCTQAGYYSIPLTMPVAVANGDDFVVVMRIRTPGYRYPIPTDSYDTYSQIETGKCYMSPDGSSGSWTDVGMAYDRDIGIRARAASQPSTVPTPPSGLTAMSIACDQIELTWIDNSDSEDGFKVERSDDGVNFNQIATVETNVTTKIDSGLTALKQYWYRVRAYNSEGDSAFSNISSDTTPACPQPPVILLSTSSLVFESDIGNNPSDQVFEVSNSGEGILEWMITDDANWLTCSPASGQEYSEIAVSVNSSGLSAGTYAATITVSSTNASNSPQFISVSLNLFSTTSRLNISSSTGAPAPENGGTTNPPPGDHSYSTGSNVQVTAIPDQDYRFSYWNGDIDPSWTFDEEMTVYMNVDKSVSANFCTKCGDVNGDLSVTPGDAQRAFEIYLGKIADPTPCELENADVNCSGVEFEPNVTPGDAQAIFNKYLSINELPSDCSGNSRIESASLASILKRKIEDINVSIDVSRVTPDNVVLINIIIDNPYDLKAFGLDLSFPSDIIEFVLLEKTEFTENLDAIDVNEISKGVLRLGGYRSVPIMMRAPVIVTLVFEVIGEVKQPLSITINNTVDDIAHSFIRTAFISR